jgi:hypothetical protein
LSHRQKVLNRTIGVEEGSAHGAIDIRSREPHALHIGNGCLALATHRQGRRVIETL